MENRVIAKNMLWNSIGSFIHLFSQWLVTVLVVRLSGNYIDAGTLSLAVSITAVFSLIGCYSVRNYQVSDITNKFSDSEYVLHRIIFCLIANAGLLIFLIIMKYDMLTAITIFSYMMYRNCSIIIDVFSGIAQKRWRMDISGLSFIIRGVFELAAFCIIEYYFKNLLMAILAMTVVSSACMIFIDISGVKKLCTIKIESNLPAVKKLTVICFPLFCYGILANIIVAIPKIYFEFLFGKELLGYYTSIAAPTVIVQTVASYIFSPLVPIFSDYYLKKDKRFVSLFFKITAVILLVGTAAVIGSYFLGDWALSLVFGNSILKYSYLFIPAIILSLLTAMSWFAGTLLIVMRNNKYLILGSIIGVAVCIILTVFLIPSIGIDGINIVTISATTIQLLVFDTAMIILAKQNEGDGL